MDIKEVEKYYDNMSDSELVRIATTDAQGLRPEVYGIIEKEVVRRNLNPEILLAVDAQNRHYSIEEMEEYASHLRGLYCPICGSDEYKLNGTLAFRIVSFIFYNVYDIVPSVACPDCLDSKNNSAMITTLILGWWGFPLAFFKTPLYIYRNYQSKKENRMEKANSALLSFTLSKIGEIEAYKAEREKIQEIIHPSHIY